MSWIEVFNPGYRYTLEERQRKQVERKTANSEGNPLGVDLDSGVIRASQHHTAGDGEQDPLDRDDEASH